EKELARAWRHFSDDFRSSHFFRKAARLGCFVVANCRVRNVKEKRRFAVALTRALLRCLNFGLPRPDPSFASAPGEFGGFAFRDARVERHEAFGKTGVSLL